MTDRQIEAMLYGYEANKQALRDRLWWLANRDCRSVCDYSALAETGTDISGGGVHIPEAQKYLEAQEADALVMTLVAATRPVEQLFRVLEARGKHHVSCYAKLRYVRGIAALEAADLAGLSRRSGDRARAEIIMTVRTLMRAYE